MSSETLFSLLRAAQSDDDSGLFHFYGELLTLRDSYKRTLPRPALPLRHSSGSAPLLRWQDIAPEASAFFAWLTRIGQLWEQRDPGALDELEALTPAESLAAAERWYREGSSGLGSVVDALLANALAPYLEAAAEQLRDELPDTWRQPYCPLCGGNPDIARYDERKSRYNCLCERCGTQWTITRDACLFCGETDEERRGFYSSEDDLYRVLVCDNCGYYLKVVNSRAARQMGYTPLLEAERLLTPGLDLTAAQEGYSRPIAPGASPE